MFSTRVVGRLSSLSHWIAFTGALMAVACSREPPPRAQAVAQLNELVVLPNNTALYSRKDRVVAVRREGDVVWEAVLPSNDSIVAQPAVALNSVAYVRGAKAIHALSPEGKWLWSKPIDGAAALPAHASVPVAFPDSTVAIVVGNEIVKLDETGALRWRASLPEGTVATAPRAGMDGALFVPTTAGLYCLSPDGSISWRRSVGN
jgi:outer membrane protein assembly factor BamB